MPRLKNLLQHSANFVKRIHRTASSLDKDLRLYNWVLDIYTKDIHGVTRNNPK